MLALSCLVMAGTCGLTLLVALWHVLRIAWRTPCRAGGAARIIVPGYRLAADGSLSGLYRARLQRARRLADACPTARIFVLGGTTRPGLPSEASAGAAWLRDGGIAPARLHREDRSRHTLENLVHYRAAFPPDPGEPAVLVSSRFHLARAMLMARGLGLACAPCAAEATRHVALHPGRLLTEAFLVHWYVVGRCFSRLTGNARMLARIS